MGWGGVGAHCAGDMTYFDPAALSGLMEFTQYENLNSPVVAWLICRTKSAVWRNIEIFSRRRAIIRSEPIRSTEHVHTMASV